MLELWALACVGLLLVQDGFILAKDAKWTYAAMRIESREPHVLPLFPEMNGPMIRQILGASGAIGVGPRELGHEVLIYGQIAQAGRIGAHELVPVGAKASAAEVRSLVDAHVRYVLWLTSAQVPPALVSHAIARGAEGPMTYLELVK